MACQHSGSGTCMTKYALLLTETLPVLCTQANQSPGHSRTTISHTPSCQETAELCSLQTQQQNLQQHMIPTGSFKNQTALLRAANNQKKTA